MPGHCRQFSADFGAENRDHSSRIPIFRMADSVLVSRAAFSKVKYEVSEEPPSDF
jgi:hypothetical protein